MKQIWLLLLAAGLALNLPVMGQESDAASDQTKSESESVDAPPGDKKAEMPSLIPKLPDYDSDMWTRDALLGGVGGRRGRLAEDGIFFEIDLTQIIQGNAHGGADTNNAFRYSGSVDYTLKFDTARMGLWPAGMLMVKGETMFGRSINGKVGSLMSPNADALFPVPDDPGMTTLTDVVFTQFLSERVGFAVGKIDFRGGDQNVFAHNENTQFMNLALLANPIVLPYAPYTALTGAIFFRPSDGLTVSFTALDSFGSPTTSGFDTAFHAPQGTAFFTEWDFTIRPFGLPGHQRFGAVYSNKDFRLLDQDARIGGPLSTLRSLRGVIRDPEIRPDDWGLYYNFDQYLYTEEEDPSQGIGVFGRLGWSSGEANPFEAFYSLGVGGKGIIPNRDNDTYGIGYYFLDMSDDLPSLMGLTSEQGVELYYNIELAPWLHLTPDLQVIVDPGGSNANDVAIVYGLRMQMSF